MLDLVWLRCIRLERVNPLKSLSAITAFFGAVAKIGSIRASLIMNVEPITTISLGFVVLGQVLTAWQLAGAALVIGAILALKWDADRRVAADG